MYIKKNKKENQHFKKMHIDNYILHFVTSGTKDIQLISPQKLF